MDLDLTSWNESLDFSGNYMCTSQALPQMSSKPGSKSPLCKVCGDESSGFHYGVDSCEGCKGFFRRCITQGMTHKCANEEKCEITPFTRNSCQYCRLKKCFAVGMSREASRLGRRPKRLKDSSGEPSKSHSGNLPIAPYPSPAELYRLRMAELQKLLQANGTFKSELMQAFLSAAQASFREHAKHNTSTGNTNVSTAVPSSSDILNQNQTLYSPGMGVLSNDSGYASLNSPLESKIQPTLQEQVNNNTQFLENSPTTTSMYSSMGPGNLNGNDPMTTMTMTTLSTGNNNNSTYLGSPEPAVTIKQEPGMMPVAACLLSLDPNSNYGIVNTDKILAEVKAVPSETRRVLINQVTEAVVEAHLATCKNTYQTLADANERLEQENDEFLPDFSKLTLKASSMWQQFLANMCPEIKSVVAFAKKLPGFTEIEQDDQIKLIKQGSFEVIVARFCLLVDHVNNVMMDPSFTMKCPKEVVQAMPLGKFFEEFFIIASYINPLKLTDGEIGIFASILMICPERKDLKNKKAISKIQSLFQQALYYLMKRNHADPPQTFVKLLNTIPLFRRINEQHSMALNNIKMTMPENYEQQFPALHKEVFDGKV